MYENQMQSRKWQLTINNPQDHGMTHDEIIDRTQKFNPSYMCLADEIGEQGTYHTHVFFCSSSPMRFGTVKKRFLPPILTRPTEQHRRIGTTSERKASGQNPVNPKPVWKVLSRSSANCLMRLLRKAPSTPSFCNV